MKLLLLLEVIKQIFDFHQDYCRSLLLFTSVRDMLHWKNKFEIFLNRQISLWTKNSHAKDYDKNIVQFINVQ